jgi:hypothetical protein
MGDDVLLALLSEEERQEWPALGPAEQAALRDTLTQRVPPTDDLRALTRHLFDRGRVSGERILRRQHFEGARAEDAS